MYEPSRLLISFFIAGFKHWDGPMVLSRLKVGQALELRCEPDNPHDPAAVAILHDGTKIGYVPTGQNDLLSVMSFYGHASAFECRVLQVAPEKSPWEQVRVGIYVCDARVNAE